MTEPPARARVLVVDDDEGVLRLESTSLRRAGYDVVSALSTYEAFALVQTRPPDLIVTDYRLAGPTTGLDLLRQIREQGNDVPVILVTAFSDEQRILEALRAGVGDVIPKTAGFLDYLPNAVSTALSRRRAEQQAAEAWRLRESERYFQTLAESLPQLVWTARPDGCIDYCNSRYREFTGIRSDSGGGWDWAPAIHPEDREATLRAWTEAVQAGTVFEIEHRIRRVDGECRWHMSRAVPFGDRAGRVVRWYGTATDVHDVKVAEERLRLATQAARMFAFEWDPRTGELVRSGECLDILGHDVGVQEALARYLERVHPDDRALMQSAVCMLRPEAPTYERTYRVVRCDGRIVFLNETARAAFDTRGGLARVVGMAADVTDRMRAEAERRDLLAREKAARAEAERANILKDEFLGILSHELRTPLNAILGWAQILSTRPLPDAQQVTAILGTIARNARMQACLIDDLLDMSRIVSGTLRIEFTPVQLPSVVDAALESIAPAADAKRMRVTHRYEPRDTLAVRGDPARLQQVVWNLLSNAVKFTPAEGIVAVDVFRRDGDVVLQVTDSGPGVPPEFLPHLFERFRQADATATRPHGGLGLGLSIVRNLVEMHGGTVTADPASPHGGARFTVAIPATAEAASAMDVHDRTELTGAIPRSGADLHGLRVLAVDDEADTRELVARILDDYGATVEIADSVDAALARFGEARFDVLVVDIAMPGRDGYELIRTVRDSEDEARRNVPAIALTAHVNVEDRRNTLTAGFTLHAGKPIEPAQLAYAVAVAAGRAQASGTQPR